MNTKFAGFLFALISIRALLGHLNLNSYHDKKNDAQNYTSVEYNSVSMVTTDWIKPEKASCNDLEGAYINILHNSISSILQATSWNFSIPETSFITGITLRFSGKSDAMRVQDVSIALLKDGTPFKTDVVEESWPIATRFHQQYPKPGQDPLWNTQWTAKDINSPTFGVQIQVQSSSPVDTVMQAFIYCMEITVSYSMLDNSSKIIESFSPSGESSGNYESGVTEKEVVSGSRTASLAVFIVSALVLVGVVSTMTGIVSLLMYRKKLIQKQEEKLETIELLSSK